MNCLLFRWFVVVVAVVFHGHVLSYCGTFFLGTLEILLPSGKIFSSFVNSWISARNHKLKSPNIIYA
jgi:hypothetical protein